jgi:hypothetical protein
MHSILLQAFNYQLELVNVSSMHAQYSLRGIGGNTQCVLISQIKQGSAEVVRRLFPLAFFHFALCHVLNSLWGLLGFGSVNRISGRRAASGIERIWDVAAATLGSFWT